MGFRFDDPISRNVFSFFHTAYNIIILLKKRKTENKLWWGITCVDLKVYGDVGSLTEEALFSSGTASYHHFTNDFIQNDSEDFMVVIVGFGDAYLADENRLKIIFETQTYQSTVNERSDYSLEMYKILIRNIR